MLPALASRAEETVPGGRATHCRVTVWAPGIGRSISRSRRLQTNNKQMHHYNSSPSAGGSPLPPRQPQESCTGHSGKQPSTSQAMWGPTPASLGPQRWLQGQQDSNISCRLHLIVLWFFFFLLCTNHILLWRLPLSHLSPKPQPSPPKYCPASSLNVSLTLAPNSESST